MTIHDLWGFLRHAWSYELFAIDGQAIPIGTILAATALVAVGWLLARWGSHALRRLVVRRLRVDEGPAAAVETLGFYAVRPLDVRLVGRGDADAGS